MVRRFMVSLVLAAGLVLPASASALDVLGPPTSSATAPAVTNSGPIDVAYTTSGDVQTIELWAEAPGDSGYALVSTNTLLDPPSFSYTPTAGDGVYSFYTVAVDTFGNREAAPDVPDAQTLLDTTAPTSTASAPATVGSGPVTITYSADDGNGSGVQSVELWAQAPGDTAFQQVATNTSPGTTGSFDYTPSAGDGTYFFYTVAVDAVGNRETVPAVADTRTQRDTAAPAPAPAPTPTPTSTPTPAPSATPVAPAPSSPPPTSDPVIAQAPAATTSTADAPSLPLVAALTMVGKQTLHSAVAKGLKFRVYAYRAIQVTISATLTKRSAKALGLSRHARVARHVFRLTQPAVYQVTLPLSGRAARAFRRAKRASLVLKTVLSAPAGSSTSSSVVTLHRT